MKKYTLLSFLIGVALICSSQDPTNDALNAVKVKNIVFVLYGMHDEKPALFFIPGGRDIDNDNHINSINVAVPKKVENLTVRSKFINPISNRIQTVLTSVSDPNYEAISKFVEQVTVFNNLINPVENLNSKESIIPRPTQTDKFIGENDIANNLKDIKAPSLAEWKYLLLKNKEDEINCISGINSLLSVISPLDNSLFSSRTEITKKGFNSKFANGFEELKNTTTAHAYLQEYEAFNKTIKALDEENKTDKNNIERLKGFKVETINKNCIPFLEYSASVLDQFLMDANQIIKTRELLLSSAKALMEELAKFNSNIDSPEQNSFVVKRIPIDSKKIQDLAITFQEQKISVDDDRIKIEATDKKYSGTIKIREHRSFIPEVSSGIFYTNLTYPKYGVEENNGGFTVREAGKDHYRVVAATHLNLIPNLLDGQVHPMLQLGVGTGKDLPSILAGAGLRFTGDLKFAIAFGAITTWRKELDKFHVGDVVKGTAALEEDLHYELQKKPSFYIGLQVNF